MAENQWKCNWCWRKFNKFEGYEFFRDIKEYTPEVQDKVYKLRKQYPDNDYYKHLECKEVAGFGGRMWCPKSMCVEHGVSFKHRTQYYRHKSKYHKIEPEIDEDLIDKKKMVKNICRKIDKLYAQGYRAEDLEWSVEVRESSESEESD